MADKSTNRAKELFLAALEVAEEDRAAWLAEQCEGNDDLFLEVQSLLDNDKSAVGDPLERRLDSVLHLPPSISTIDHTEKHGDAQAEITMIDSEHFLSRLSEVGVLPQEEIDALGRSVSVGESTVNPRQLASQLVQDGKLTEYQAKALLKGQPELLIDKYLILDLLDAGGMGMVFKALHRPMNRLVAIKMIAQHLLASPEQVKRFQREVRVAATLEHPNVVRAYDADQSKGVHFLVMEYVRGDNLARLVHREGPLSVERAVDYIRQAAIGLRYAQKHGIIHRDIKPGNLMLTDEGLVKILDLGLANIDESFRLAQQSSLTSERDDATERSLAGSELTTAGAVLGTVSFMAPEQSLDAHTADTRADIYSLGCTLYYLLIGEAPYKGETIFKVFMQHREADIPTLRNKRADVPEQVEAIFRKMLAKVARDRYQSMGELLAAIEDCDIASPTKSIKRNGKGASTTASTRRPDGIGSTVEVSRKKPLAHESITLRGLIAGMIALILLLALGSYWWRGFSSKKDSDATSTASGNAKAEGFTQNFPVHSDSERKGVLRFNGGTLTLPQFDWNDTAEFTWEAYISLKSDRHMEVLTQYGRQFNVYLSREWEPRWAASITTRQSESRFARTNSPLEPNKFYHLALVAEQEQIRLFVDGNLIAESPNHHGFRVQSAPIMIGGNTKYAFDGQIDDVRFSNFSRYNNNFSPPTSLSPDEQTVALYQFDGEGVMLIDSSGNGYDVNLKEAASGSVSRVHVQKEASMSAADLLATGEWEWRTVERLPKPINSDSDDTAAMTADGLTIVISQIDPRGHGNHDLLMATRDSVDSPWGEPVNLGAGINSAAWERDPALSPDGLSLCFNRREGYGKGHDYPKILISRRETRSSPWSESVPLNIKSRNTPHISADARTMLMIQDFDLYVAARESSESVWGKAERIPAPVSSKTAEFAPDMSEDGRLMVFVRGGDKLMLSTRDSSSMDVWSAPQILDLLNRGSVASPRLIDNGRYLLYSSGTGQWNSLDVYLARLVRKDAPVEPIKGLGEEPPPATMSDKP